MPEQAKPGPRRSTCRACRKSGLFSPQAWRGDDGARQVKVHTIQPATPRNGALLLDRSRLGRTFSMQSSSLSFTAKFETHKPMIFLEKVSGWWFLASEKPPHGTGMGLTHCSGAKNKSMDGCLDQCPSAACTRLFKPLTPGRNPCQITLNPTLPRRMR